MSPLEVLRFHIESELGLLSRLRPYAGTSLDDCIADLSATYEALERGEGERNFAVVDAAFSIIYLVRRWAIEPEGSLATSGKMSAETAKQLRDAVLGWERSLASALGALASGEDP